MSYENIYNEWKNWLSSFCSLNIEDKLFLKILPIYKHRFSNKSIQNQLAVIYASYELMICSKISDRILDYYSKSLIISQIIEIRYSELKRLTNLLSEMNSSATENFDSFMKYYAENCKIISDEISLLIHEQQKLDKQHSKELEKSTK